MYAEPYRVNALPNQHKKWQGQEYLPSTSGHWKQLGDTVASRHLCVRLLVVTSIKHGARRDGVPGKKSNWTSYNART
jgi:hypothetical protein